MTELPFNTDLSRTDRRGLLGWFGIAVGASVLAACGSPVQARTFKVNYTDAQWRGRLTKAQYWVLREEGTEQPFSSPLNEEHRKGTFLCAGCSNELYSSATKFESGTGWPSFWQPLQGAVITSTDFKIGYPRTAISCADCGGHLGHVFKDGPKPTGLRYCMNGVAMKFQPA
jgi:peptide-methionine (R)-S-oxide reductase